MFFAPRCLYTTQHNLVSRKAVRYNTGVPRNAPVLCSRPCSFGWRVARVEEV